MAPISPYFLGLNELDWVGSITAGGLLTVLLAVFVLFGWLVYRHALPADQAEPPPTEGRLINALRTPIDATLAQWHLAFYRAARSAGSLSHRCFRRPCPTRCERACRRSRFIGGVGSVWGCC